MSTLAWARQPPGAPGHRALDRIVEQLAGLRDARAVNDKVRLFARLGAALIAAKEGDADLDGAVAVPS